MLPHFDQNQPVSYHEGKKCIVFIMFYLFIFNITPFNIDETSLGKQRGYHTSKKRTIWKNAKLPLSHAVLKYMEIRKSLLDLYELA